MNWYQQAENLGDKGTVADNLTDDKKTMGTKSLPVTLSKESPWVTSSKHQEDRIKNFRPFRSTTKAQT